MTSLYNGVCSTYTMTSMSFDESLDRKRKCWLGYANWICALKINKICF